MTEFLLELLCEEIPARMQLKAKEDLKIALQKHLMTHQLAFKTIETHITPRRMVAVIDGLADQTTAKIEERRGPRINAPEAALQGFLRSVGLVQEQCEQRDGYWYAVKSMTARSAQDILPEIIEAILIDFYWPKSMRWSGSDQTWVRPLRRILAVLGGKVLVFTLPRLGLTSTNQTVGHRFLSDKTIYVSDFQDYQTKLTEACVVLSHETRQKIIKERLESLGQDCGYQLEIDEKLLEEVSGLVEYPEPLLGTIDPSFMGLPKAVLSTSMRVHQKYFTYVDRNGKVAPIFGLVANTKPTDGSKEMVNGYERVLRARLSDAQFFFEQDQKIPLDHLNQKLETMVFHAELGSLAQKIKRLQQLVSSEAAYQAAHLCKADLMTQMVGEFPELQGIMGEIYAQLEGYPSEISQAIREHYLPQGAHDALPETAPGVEVALAEKIDTLVGFFAIGAAPTGSKDPYGLRRMALGLIRIVRERNLRDFNLTAMVEKSYDLYQQQGIKIVKEFSCDQIYQFICERLEHALKSEGIRLDAIRAVLKAQPQTFNVWSISERSSALHQLLQTTTGLTLQEAFRRAQGILADVSNYTVNPKQFIADSETHLYEKLCQIAHEAPQLLKDHDYHQLMAQLADIKHPLDQFFELKINDDNPQVRQNRLALLQDLVRQTLIIADLSQLEGL